MTEVQIANRVHLEFLEERADFLLAESLGLAFCGFCSMNDGLTILDSTARTYQIHNYAGTTACMNLPVCDGCYEQGACDEGDCLDMMNDDHHCQSCIRRCTDPSCRAMVEAAMLRRALPERAYGTSPTPAPTTLRRLLRTTTLRQTVAGQRGRFTPSPQPEERDDWVAAPCDVIHRDGLKYCNRVAVDATEALLYISTSAVLEV